MAIVQCNFCSNTLPIEQVSRLTHCPRCGKPLGSQTAAHVEPAKGDDPVLAVFLRIYCRTLIVLLLYVLSTGPMYWLVFEAFNTSGYSFLAKLYYPIVFACEYSETICNWFDWYIGLWVY